MKTEKAIDLLAVIWVGVLMSISVIGICYALIQVITGNANSTASFEF